METLACSLHNIVAVNRPQKIWRQMDTEYLVRWHLREICEDCNQVWTFEFLRQVFDNRRRIEGTGFLSPFIQEKDKISEILSSKQRKRDDEIERLGGQTGAQGARDTRTTTTKRRNSGRRSLELSYAWRSKSWRWKRSQRLLAQSFPS